MGVTAFACFYKAGNWSNHNHGAMSHLSSWSFMVLDCRIAIFFQVNNCGVFWSLKMKQCCDITSQRGFWWQALGVKRFHNPCANRKMCQPMLPRKSKCSGVVVQVKIDGYSCCKTVSKWKGWSTAELHSRPFPASRLLFSCLVLDLHL